MRITYLIAAQAEGRLDEVMLAELIPGRIPQPPTLEEVTASLAELAFIVETVAHLTGKEKAMLPSADRARALIERLAPRTI